LKRRDVGDFLPLRYGGETDIQGRQFLLVVRKKGTSTGGRNRGRSKGHRIILGPKTGTPLTLKPYTEGGGVSRTLNSTPEKEFIRRRILTWTRGRRMGGDARASQTPRKKKKTEEI